MSKIKLIKKGAEGPLSFSCIPIPEFETRKVWSPEHRDVVVSMVKILLDNKLEGLSANQVGSDIRAFITNVPHDRIRVFINPIMDVVDFDEELVPESCGSYPRSSCSRWRHRHVIMEYKNLAGLPHILDTSDSLFKEPVSKALSYRLQHEMEHMQGANVRLEPEDQQTVLASSEELLVHSVQPVSFEDHGTCTHS